MSETRSSLLSSFHRVSFRFIDLLCLKRSGELIRLVMSRDDIASCAEEKFPFEICSTIVETDRNLLYVLPAASRSIRLYKIIDTNPSLQLIKELDQDELRNDDGEATGDYHFLRLALSPDQSRLVALASNRTIFLFDNRERIRPLAQVRSLSPSSSSLSSSAFSVEVGKESFVHLRSELLGRSGNDKRLSSPHVDDEFRR